MNGFFEYANASEQEYKYIDTHNHQAAGVLMMMVNDNPAQYLELVKPNFVERLKRNLIDLSRDYGTYFYKSLDPLSLYNEASNQAEGEPLSYDTLKKRSNGLLCLIMGCPDNKDQELNVTIEQFLDFWLNEIKTSPKYTDSLFHHLKDHLYYMGRALSNTWYGYSRKHFQIIASLLGDKKHGEPISLEYLIKFFTEVGKDSRQETVVDELNEAFSDALMCYIIFNGYHLRG